MPNAVASYGKAGTRNKMEGAPSKILRRRFFLDTDIPRDN